MIIEEAQSATARKSYIAIMLFMAFIWFIFIQSAYKFSDKYWYSYLLYSRVAMLSSAGILACYAIFRKKSILSVSSYFLLCMLNQAVLSILEGKSQTNFYEYISYMALVSTLAQNGKYKDWIKTSLPIILISAIVPLFFKDAKLFNSLSTIAFTFTTPIAVYALALIVARITSTKFEVLELNIDLQNSLLEAEVNYRQTIESELMIAKNKMQGHLSAIAFSEVAAQVAHDIRSPLAVLTNSSQTLDDFSKSALQRIEDIANDLLKRRKEVQSVSNVEKPTIGVQKINLNLILQQIEKEKKIELSHLEKIKLSLEIEEQDIFIFADSSRLHRCLSNLINNSVQAINESGEISIKQTRNHELVEIRIRDNGKGIDPGTLKKLQAREIITTRMDGNGLGLKFAIDCVESWQGKLKIQSELEIGTEIVISLPIQEAEINFSQTPIILIDDDEIVKKLWKKSAEKNEISLHCFSDEDPLLDRLSEYSLDSVIYIDSQLADGKSGEEIAEKIAKCGFKKIILSTGYPASSFSKEWREAHPWIHSIVGKSPPWLT